jgi:hypothetical protein
MTSSGAETLNCKNIVLPDGTWYFYDREGPVVTAEPGEEEEPVDEIDHTDDDWPQSTDNCQDPLYNCGDDLLGGGDGGDNQEDPCDGPNPPESCEEDEPEPCETEDPAIDGISTNPGLEDFFEESYGTDENPLPDDQRNERAAFVIKNGSTYSLQNIEPDRANMAEFRASNVTFPNKAVGIIHTHTASPGETINDFRYQTAHNINPITDGVPTYNADEVSGADEAFAKSANLPLYVMDTEAIRKIESSNPGQYADEYERCGF